MGFRQNTLTNEEYLIRLKALIPILETGHQTKDHITEMFFLYNDRLSPRSTKSGCGRCRARVHDRLKTYLNELTG